jgi:hypothetical protein
MATQTEQIREAVTVDDVVTYKVSISVVDKGDLPSDKIFVISINDETDSKEDTFARVATIADFTEVQENRSDAIDDDEVLYRTNAFVLYYDNLETAINAQTVLKERIDELVNNYEDYQEDFETVVAEVTVHPQVGESTFDAAVTAYQDALRDTLDAEEDRDEKEEEYNDKVIECSDANTDATKAAEIAADCATTKGYFDTLETAFIALDNDGDVFLTAAQTYYQNKVVAPVPDSFDVAFLAAINQFIADLRVSEAVKTQAATDKTDFATICGKRSTENDTTQAAKATCDTELKQAKTDFDDAQAAVEVAKQAENAALAAVQALKPDFDPTSVEPTPEGGS